MTFSVTVPPTVFLAIFDTLRHTPWEAWTGRHPALALAFERTPISVELADTCGLAQTVIDATRLMDRARLAYLARRACRITLWEAEWRLVLR